MTKSVPFAEFFFASSFTFAIPNNLIHVQEITFTF